MFSFEIQDFGLTKKRVALFVLVTVAAAFFEGFGMAMCLPLLEYIESGENLAVLTGRSEVWTKLILAFGLFGMKVNLTSLLGAVLLLMLLRVIFIYSRRLYIAWLSQDVLHCTRSNLFSSYLRAHLGFFDEHSTGESMNLMTTETQRVGGGFTALFEMAANGMVIAGYLFVLLWLSIPMTIFAALFLSGAGLAVSYFVRQTRNLSHLTTDANEAFSFQLVERLSAFRLIKLTATSEREIRDTLKASQKVRDHMYWLNKLNARVDILLEPMVIAGGGLILYGAVSVFHMSLAQVGLFLLILLRLLPVSKEMVRSRQSFLSNIGSLQAVSGSLREARFEIEPPGGKKSFMKLEKGIEIRDLTFFYSDQEKPALKDLNLFIPAGKMTALVGPSGAGKSTLVDLLPGLRKPQHGQVLIDERPLEDYDLRSLRQGISFVSQDAFIFNDTVRANITFASQGATEPDIWRALEKARAGDFVRSLPQGLETVLGERGLRLSGGERQRLALARSLLQNASILILDEPTSALDSESERAVRMGIEEIRKEKNTTIIAIAHRLSTIRDADRILVLRDGQLLSEGTHQDLMGSEHWYAMVNELQSA